MMNKKKWMKRLLIVCLVLAVIIAAVFIYGRWFVKQEQQVRTTWKVDTGEMVGKDEEQQVEIREAPVESDLTVIQILPEELEEEGFTYYDEAVQQRLDNVMEHLQGMQSWTAQSPLAVLNPYGTGSNGLYLYFSTDRATEVTYTIHVEDENIPDYTRTAEDASGSEYTKNHEFQMIGLVPGETNQVTMVVRGSMGTVRQQIQFSIDMPETASGYDTRLQYTDGESSAELSDGLFAQMRTNGTLGYVFLFDNSGIMRYEFVLEGYGMDRILEYGGDLITSVSAGKIARINSIGKVTASYELGEYLMHHDLVLGQEGKVIALAERDGDENLEDLVIEVDLETGEVTELIDFKTLFADYYKNETREVAATDDEFYYAGMRDWIHLNTIQYLAADDSVIVSSRETSTIMKIKNVHSAPETDWFAGNPAFWEGTSLEEYCLEPEGEFAFQYGQHSVEYAGAGDEDGVYYLRMFDNNYYSVNSRDIDMELEEGVSKELYGIGGENSYMYLYEINENERTFTLADSFAVPYSSIVSNVAFAGDSDNFVINSGVANLFGEYDSEGTLIRKYDYDCDLQGYRTFKLTFEGFWFR